LFQEIVRTRSGRGKRLGRETNVLVLWKKKSRRGEAVKIEQQSHPEIDLTPHWERLDAEGFVSRGWIRHTPEEKMNSALGSAVKRTRE